MTPAFALTLSEDRLTLLHHAKGGWTGIGEVATDDPALSETLRRMRDRAATLAAEPLRTKLVIPDSQILYTTLPVRGAHPTETRAGLVRDLDGLTPYPVDELVFDWQEADGVARLAVVARETLDEAESFAVAHGFNPVCFVAAPPTERFPREAVFGPTAIAAMLQQEDARPGPGDGDAQRGGPVSPAPPETRNARAPEPAHQAKLASPFERITAALARNPEDRDPAGPSAGKPPAPTPMVGRIGGARTVRPPEPPERSGRRPRTAPQGANAEGTDGSRQPDREDRHRRPPAPRAPAPARAARPMTQSKAGPRSGRSAAGAEPISPVDAPRPPEIGATEQPPTTARRGTVGAGTRTARPARGGPTLRGGLILSAGLVLFMGGIALWSLISGGSEPTDAPRTAEIAGLSGAEPTSAAPPPRPSPTASSARAESGSGTGPAGAGGAPWQAATDLGEPPPRDRIGELYIAAVPPAIRPPMSVALPDPRPTVAGDRPLPQQRTPPGPDQILAGNAAGLPAATPEGTRTAGGVTVFAGLPETLPPTRPDDRATDEPEAAAIPAESLPEAAPAPIPVPVLLQRPPITPPPRPRVVTPATVASTDPAAPDTGGAETKIEIVVTTGRPAIVPPPRPASDAPAPETAPAAAPDDASAPASPPPVPGGETTAPVTVAVTSGRPALLPPPRPAAPEPDDAAGVRAPATAAGPAATPEAVARLAAFRPRPRPAGSVPAETPNMPPPALAPLDSGQVDEAVAAALAEEAANAAARAGSVAQAAVVPSMRPSARPEGLGARTTVTAPAVPASAAAVAPKIPTTASVAKQATVPNAINLRNVNLIGVYGTSTDRRALVRLPSGRYVKVKVGDGLDGGRIAAIGDNQLRYVKNGRMIVLDLPGG